MKNPKMLLSDIISDNWWLLLVRGLAAIAFGVLAWLVPGVTLATLILLFGAYALVDGIAGVYHAIVGRKTHEDWVVMLLWGLVGIGAGIVTFLVPGITALTLLFYIAAWAIAKGVLEIVLAIRLRKEIEGEWLMVLGGLLSVVFGVILMVWPGAGILTLVWLLGIYAIAFGIVLVYLAFKARSFGKKLAHA